MIQEDLRKLDQEVYNPNLSRMQLQNMKMMCYSTNTGKKNQ